MVCLRSLWSACVVCPDTYEPVGQQQLSQLALRSPYFTSLAAPGNFLQSAPSLFLLAGWLKISIL